MRVLANSRILHPERRKKFTAYELMFDPPQIHRYSDHRLDESTEIKEGSGKYVIGYRNRNHREVELFALLTSATVIDFMKLENQGKLPPERQPAEEEQIKVLGVMREIQSDFHHDELIAKYRAVLHREECDFRFIGGGLISVSLESKKIQLTRGSTSTGFVPWSILAESFEHDRKYHEFTVQIVLGEDDRDIGMAINRREVAWYREIGVPVILPKKTPIRKENLPQAKN
jgi:hypothetical protein